MLLWNLLKRLTDCVGVYLPVCLFEHELNYEYDFLISFWACNIDYENISHPRSNQKDGHEIWPDNGLASSCHEFGRTKKSYS